MSNQGPYTITPAQLWSGDDRPGQFKIERDADMPAKRRFMLAPLMFAKDEAEAIAEALNEADMLARNELAGAMGGQPCRVEGEARAVDPDPTQDAKPPLAPLDLTDERTAEQLVEDNDNPCDVCKGYPAAGRDADPGCPRCKGTGKLTVEQMREVLDKRQTTAKADARKAAEFRLMPDEVLLRLFQTDGYAELNRHVSVTLAGVPFSTAFWVLQFLIVGLGTQGARGPNADAVRQFAEGTLERMTCSHPLLAELTRRGWQRVNRAHPRMQIARPGGG